MTAILKEGDKVPEFSGATDTGQTISQADFKGKPLIVYFYPKDDTPGCTQEACDFRDNLARLQAKGAAIIGVSKDSVKKHEKFRDKYSLNFPLLADEDGSVCEAFGTIAEKSMFGKKYMGIDRSTFLIDENGVVQKIWRKVKVKGHADEVAEALEAMQSAKAA